jgi:hypothetical protein
VTIRALKDQAAGCLREGRLGAAVSLYRRLSYLEPDDGLQAMRLGRLLIRMNRRGEAVVALRDAVQTFLRQGDETYALAASRLILEVEPTHEGARQLRRELAGPAFARRTVPYRAPAAAPAE